ncbi:Rieske (2Fe-2S) protein [Devosia sp. SL43]|uniref:Rieske (2Fe-2S) protein n=1 Tax=Devosia sp. SL43 TaxID=2806348 RepID=UPI001F21AA42|nr:Rieske 2Fe-2S domain-containing protein [Devosia sp. SL43]UJW85683.1 Rieske 2Fe-2S domain-containing protein [Devosia sp. SL43]
MTSEPLFLCRVDDIGEGGSIGVAPDHRGRDRVLLVRQGQAIYGYINNCPHYDRAPLGWKKDAFLSGDQTRIMCAAHGALFTITDGLCELGPCLGQRLTPVALVITECEVFGLDIPEFAYGRSTQQSSGAAA